MSDHEQTLRMSAYYYTFEPTGNHAIDRILSAVACAGKAYHSTESWRDDEEWDGTPKAPHPEFGGSCPAEWIQRAANDAAAACLSGADALAREKQTCAWTEDEDGVWHTGCGTAWCSEVGGAPADHKMRFCYHCGVTLAAGPFQATREAE